MMSFLKISKWLYGQGLSIVGRAIEIWSGLPFETFLEKVVGFWIKNDEFCI